MRQLNAFVTILLFVFSLPLKAYETSGKGDFVRRIEYVCSDRPHSKQKIDYVFNQVVSDAIDSAKLKCRIFGANVVIKKVYLFGGF